MYFFHCSAIALKRRQGNVIFLGGLWDLCPGKPEPQDGPINPPFPRSLRKNQHRPVHSMGPSAIASVGSVESFWRHLGKQLPLATMETRSHGTDNTWYALSATFGIRR